MKLRWLSIALAFACHTTPPCPGPRPEHWARALEVETLPNFHEVTPTLFRGAMPEPAGFAELERRGIRTVVSLRQFTRDVAVPPTNLTLLEIPMWTWAPNDEQVLEFLSIATDPARQPVFVHCAHGADRTGVMCALYRVVVQDWSKDDAIAELRGGGFGHHELWDELAQFVRDADVENLRRKLAERRASSR
jgi:tyrosine-protein phosphatase SIW14